MEIPDFHVWSRYIAAASGYKLVLKQLEGGYFEPKPQPTNNHTLGKICFGHSTVILKT